MKLGNWRSRTQQAEPAASQLVPALDRVREMREQSAWEPVTPPSSIRGRADQVAVARKRVAIPPLASEHSGGSEQRTATADWRHDFVQIFYASSALLAGILAIYVFAPDQEPPPAPPEIEPTTMAYELPDAPSYASLTEEQAIAFARRAARDVSLNATDWAIDPKFERDPEVYLRRANDYEGTIVYRHSYYSSNIVRVRLKMDPDEKIIVCTVAPH